MGDYIIEGDQLELKCTVEVQRDIKLDIKWKLPNGNIAIEV